MIRVWFLIGFRAYSALLCFGATEPHKIAIIAESDVEGMKVQHAIVFEESTVTHVRNSNFLCGPTPEVWLGVFETGYGENDKLDARVVRELLARAPKAPLPVPAPPHGLRIFLNNAEFEEQEPAYRFARQILASDCSRRPSSMKKGEVLTLAAAEKKKAECRRPAGGVTKCLIEGLGLADFK